MSDAEIQHAMSAHQFQLAKRGATTPESRLVFSEYHKHWQLGLDLNQPSEDRQAHRLQAAKFFRELWCLENGVTYAYAASVIHEVTCPRCNNYYPGHATGAGDVCDCKSPIPR